MSNSDEPQALPKQEQFFSTEKLRRTARAGTQLPDPAMAPFGYDPKSRFNHLFPALELPALFPPQRLHPEDHISFGSPDLPPHKLYLGDNLYVLRGLPSECIDLIYIDPPFFSNRTYTQIWGDDNEVRSFGDIFQDGMFSYLAWLNARLWEMKRVLKSTGSIYVHCDWHASHYIKCEMDKIFGYERFRNEVVWWYHMGAKSRKEFSRKHDVLLRYTKSDQFTFNIDDVRIPYKESSADNNFYFVDEQGRRYREKPDRKTGKRYRYYLDDGQLPEDVWDIPTIPAISDERLGYPTQKPEALLERVIRASSNVGDVVADFFMGGGTAGAAALRLNRTFIGSDISRVAVSVTATRLIDLAEQISGIDATVKAQAKLPGSESGGVADVRIGYVGSYPQEKFAGIPQDQFIKFVLTLYGAAVFTGDAKNLHGLANNKLVLSVGPGDPKDRVPLSHVEGALKETLRQYAQQLAEGQEKVLQVIGWSFDPQIEGWKGKAVRALNEKGLKLQIELIALSAESFRQRVFRNVGESNLDLKFNRLGQLLAFTGAPYAGTIGIKRQVGGKVTFALQGARAVGAGAKLINAQWDFSYDGQRFADREYALMRNKVGSGDFEALLEAEYTFPRDGSYTIAARVQDNLDGQATAVATVTLEAGRARVVS